MISIIHIAVFFTSLFGTPDCKEEARKAYDNLKEAYGTEQKNIAIKYSLGSANWKDERSEETISLFLKGNKSKVVSDKAIIFQDQYKMVGIDKLAKKILITKPSSEDFRAKQMKVFATAFDSLFQGLKVISCEQQCQDDRSKELLRKIQFALSSKASKAMGGIETITYWLEEKRPMIKKIEMNYKVGSSIKSIEFRLIELKLNYQENVFSGSAEEQVLAHGKLVNAYKGFDLIDTRK
jgi:hypothetical protein